MIAALPSGVLSQVTSELGLISAELDGIQSGYLDAVRSRDRWGAISALDVLSERLADAEVVLGEGLAAVHNRVADRLASAGESLALLLG